MELTRQQLERQDFVDNKIMKLLQNLNPSAHPLTWDIEVIGDIRDTITQYFVTKGLCNEEDFYPVAE